MPENVTTTPDARPYEDLLDEYLDVVAEIAELLDEFGRPEREHYEEYVRFRRRKESLRSALDEKSPPQEKTGVESVVNEAFSDL